MAAIGTELTGVEMKAAIALFWNTGKVVETASGPIQRDLYDFVEGVIAEVVLQLGGAQAEVPTVNWWNRLLNRLPQAKPYAPEEVERQLRRIISRHIAPLLAESNRGDLK